MEDYSEKCTITSTTTKLPPCAIQIHPDDASIIFVATYKLEDDRSRNGTVDVYKLENDELKLQQSCRTDSSILDLKISPFDHSFLCTSQSTGNIITWKWDGSELTQQKSYQLFDESLLVLSITFSPTSEDLMVATLTSGEVVLIRITDSELKIDRQLHEHSLEAWISSFGGDDFPNLVMSGGDDAALMISDLRAPLYEDGEQEVDYSNGVADTISNNRIHQAGVTSILPSWRKSHGAQIWTGSYDDTLACLDLRKTGMVAVNTRSVVSRQELGGGVWRLLPNPKNADTVLTCCMYNGAYILDAAGATEEEPSSIVKYYKAGHDSMVYGGDWSPGGDYVATCSFYDKQLRIWKP